MPRSVITEMLEHEPQPASVARREIKGESRQCWYNAWGECRGLALISQRRFTRTRADLADASPRGGVTGTGT
eukprot:1137525-Rhodomonas_salina.1